MNSHRVIVVSFLKPLEIGFSFTEWPNHITIVPYFQANNPQELASDISTICETFKAIPYTIGSQDYFGVKGKIEVSKIITNPEIKNLHQLLFNLALQNDPQMETKYCLENYKPHITHNFQPYPKENENGFLKTLYIVENNSPTSEAKSLQNKRIISAINLS